jgi:hypothetical protein
MDEQHVRVVWINTDTCNISVGTIQTKHTIHSAYVHDDSGILLLYDMGYT